MSSDNDMQEAQWFMLLAFFIMIWMVMLIVFGWGWKGLSHLIILSRFCSSAQPPPIAQRL